MAKFVYRARSREGKAIDGEIEAANMELAADRLQSGGLIPVSISAVAVRKSGVLERIGKWLEQRNPTTVDLLFFTRQMYTLTKAGVPMIQGLSRLAESSHNPVMRVTIEQVVQDLEAGRELSSALAKHPRLFSTLYVNMIRVGETSGRLEEAFSRLHGFLARDKTTGERIKTALRYPTMVVVAISIAIGVLTTLVIPTFAKVFDKFDLQLPLPTRIILGISDFSVSYWLPVLLTLISGLTGFRYYIHTEKGRLWWDQLKLKIPVVGGILLRGTLARFARAFTMASRAGVPINQALMAVALATDNVYLGDKIREMRGSIERGDSLTRTATKTELFPPLVLQMIATGEETGQVDDMLEEVAEFYEQQVDYDVENLSAYLEPVLTVIIGIMVLVLALGIFLPMWDLTQIARR